MQNLSDNVKQLLDSMGKLPYYTSLGFYPIYYIDDGSNVLCPNCANDNDDFSEPITQYDINWENESLYCDHCSKLIECAYPSD